MGEKLVLQCLELVSRASNLVSSRPSPFMHAYISKRMRYTDSRSRTSPFLCVPHALINCVYVNERGRPGTEATSNPHVYTCNM